VGEKSLAARKRWPSICETISKFSLSDPCLVEGRVDDMGLRPTGLSGGVPIPTTRQLNPDHPATLSPLS